MNRFVSALAIVSLCLAVAPAHGQDSDKIARKCMQQKLKAAGKASLCLHKTWASAVAKGLEADTPKCDEKLLGAFGKAEAKAAKQGGQCFLGAPASAVAEALGDGVDRTLTQTGRGTIDAPPPGCNAVSNLAAYTGGDYSLAPKCVKFQAGETDCGVKTILKLREVIAADFECPKLCGDGESGCEPSALPNEFDVEPKPGDTCCLKGDSDEPKQSISFFVRCSVCVAD